MQLNFINKQLSKIVPRLIGKKIQKIESYEDFIFRFFIHDLDEVLYFSLKKPFLFFDLIEKDNPINAVNFQDFKCSKKTFLEKIKSGFFNPEENWIHLALEDHDLIIDFRDNGCIKFASKSAEKSPINTAVLLDDQETKYLDHVKAELAKFLTKEKTRFLERQKKTIQKLEEELKSLDKKIQVFTEKIAFMYQFQNNWDSKEPEFIKEKEKFLISLRKNFGEELNKTYKDLKKLQKKKTKIPLVIEEYKKKLLKPSISSSVNKTLGEKKQKAFCRIFYTSLNEIIWVGRSAKENDAISFKYSNGNDLWFHASDYPGAHVVIHHQNPSTEAINKARLLAKYYSKAKDEKKAEVVETQVKYLKKGKALGEVMLSKQKVVLVEHDPELISQLFSNLLP
jgi:uncharacterized protein (DUF2267 family)